MKLILKTTKPRNPFVAAAGRRLAGAHRAGSGAQRQAARRDTARETARELAREPARSRPSP